MTGLIPKTAAQRIDRLGRAAHLFHRYAHHPLCDEYRSEVIPLGAWPGVSALGSRTARRTRLCRGCALAFAGLVAGAIAGVLLAPPSELLLGATAVSLFLIAASFAARRRFSSKIASRLLPGGGLGLAILGGLRLATPGGLAAAAVALAAILAVAFAYRRRGPSRAPCATCPERDRLGACRGFREIVHRERAFERRALAILEVAER